MKCTHTKNFVNTFLHFYKKKLKKNFVELMPGKIFSG